MRRALATEILRDQRIRAQQPQAVAIDEKKDRLYLGGNSGEALAFDAKNGTFLSPLDSGTDFKPGENPTATTLTNYLRE